MEERLKIVDGVLQGGVGFLWCVGEGLCPSRGRPQGSPLRRGYKRRGEVRNPPVTASPCQPPLGKGAEGTGDADCHSQCAHWLRNDRGFYKGYGGGGLKTKSSPTAAKDDALHRDTTLLRRPLTRNGLTECRYTPALSRAPPFGSEAALRPSTRRLRSHVPPSVPRPLSPAQALFGGLK